MNITVERRWKKGEYTIGVLWIDGKRICNTLEPVDRGLKCEALPGKIASKEWQKCNEETKAVKAQHKSGTTAIPTGRYKITSAISVKHKARRLYLEDVPGFEYIEIHEGNTKKDTAGCILVGENTIKGRVSNSLYWLKKVNDIVFPALTKREPVFINITSTYS